MISRLKGLARSLVIRTLAAGGLTRAFHRTRVPGHLSILMYHGVVADPLAVDHPCFIVREDFKQQMTYLKHHCRVLSLERAARMVRIDQIDRPTVVLTFDDGFQNNFDIAFPILKDLGLPATIFLNTGYVDTDDTIWYCRLHHAIETTSRSVLRWQDDDFPLDSINARATASRVLSQRLKQHPHPRLNEELRSILLALDADPSEPVPSGSPYRILESHAIERMAASGLIDFGAHTESHAILSKIERREMRSEILRSLDAVSDLTGEPCELFAYPNGQPQDYDAAAISTLVDAGVKVAVTTIPGGNTSETPPMELRRYGVGSRIDMDLFRLRVHHLLPYVKSAIKKTLRR